jgi:hypothetical protein
MRKIEIPEWGFRSRERARDLKRARFAAAVAVALVDAALLMRKIEIP